MCKQKCVKKLISCTYGCVQKGLTMYYSSSYVEKYLVPAVLAVLKNDFLPAALATRKCVDDLCSSVCKTTYLLQF